VFGWNLKVVLVAHHGPMKKTSKDHCFQKQIKKNSFWLKARVYPEICTIASSGIHKHFTAQSTAAQMPMSWPS
jgi:hypothetical protein